MALQIAGIKLNHVWVGEDDSGKERVSCSYQLVSDKGQAIGAMATLSTGSNYGDTTFQPSHDTVKALKSAAALYRRDVEQMLGLVE